MIPATLGFAAEVDTAKVGAFVTRLYGAALDRGPDAGGLKYWTDVLAKGDRTAAQVIDYWMFTAPEFAAKNLTDDKFLDVAYKTFFDRAAEADGKTYWLGVLAKGATRRFVVAAMITAPTQEFQNLCKTAGIKLGTFKVTEADRPYRVVSIAAINKDQIEVKLNKPASADAVAVLKSGLVPYTTTNTWSSDRMSVVLKNSYALPAGDYTVEVKGASATIKVVAEKVGSLKILSIGMQNIDSSPVELELLNQYGQKMTVSDVTITAFNVTKGTTVAVSGTNLDLNDAGISINDKIVVTAVHSTGLTATQTVTVISQYAAGTFQLGSVVLPKDATRVLPYASSNTLYEIKYTLVNQYGQAMKLPEKTDAATTIGGIMFASTDPTVVNPAELTVDANGVLKFKALEEGSATLTAVVVATGSVTTLSIKVDGPVAAKAFTIATPASLVVAGESVVVPYVAVDQFGAQIAQKDFNRALLTGDNTGISFGTSNSSVIAVNNFSMNNTKNELRLTAAGEGTATIYVYLKGVLQNSVTFTVVKAAVATRITGLKDFPTMFEVGSSKAITVANIIVVDQYNREKSVALSDISITAKDDNADKVGFDINTNTFSAKAVAGSETFTFALKDGAGTKAGSALDVTMGTVETKDIVSYELSAAGTMYLNQTKQLTLTGKTASGQVVELKAGKVDYATSTSAAASLDKTTLVVTAGTTKGEATVAVWSGAKKLAEALVTVSDVARVATKASFDADFDYTLSNTVGSTLNMAAALTVKDQYGATMNKDGFWTS
jgi:hypothetical protein